MADIKFSSKSKMLDMDAITKSIENTVLSQFQKLTSNLQKELKLELEVPIEFTEQKKSLNKQISNLQKQIDNSLQNVRQELQKSIEDRWKFNRTGKYGTNKKNQPINLSDYTKMVDIRDYKNKRLEMIKQLADITDDGIKLKDPKNLHQLVQNIKAYEEALRRLHELSAQRNMKYKPDEGELNFEQLFPGYKLSGDMQANADAMAKSFATAYKTSLQSELESKKNELSNILLDINRAVARSASKQEGVGYEYDQKAYEKAVKAREEAQLRIDHSEAQIENSIRDEINAYIELERRLNSPDLDQKSALYDDLAAREENSLARLKRAIELIDKYKIDIPELTKVYDEGWNQSGETLGDLIRGNVDGFDQNTSFLSGFEKDAEKAKSDWIKANRDVDAAKQYLDSWKDLLLQLKDTDQMHEAVDNIQKEKIDSELRSLREENERLSQRIQVLEDELNTFQNENVYNDTGYHDAQVNTVAKSEDTHSLDTEIDDVNLLNNAIKDVITSIHNKTEAFGSERDSVVNWLDDEIEKIDELSRKADRVTPDLSLNNGGELVNNSTANGNSFSALQDSVSSATKSITRFGEAVDTASQKLGNIKTENAPSSKESSQSDFEKRVASAAKALNNQTNQFIQGVDVIVKTEEEYQRLSRKSNRSSKENTRLNTLLNERTAAYDRMNRNPVDQETFMAQRERMQLASRRATQAIQEEVKAERELAKAEAEQAEQARIAAQAKEEKAKRDAAAKVEQERQAELAETYKKFDYLEENMNRYVQGTLLGDSGDDWDDFSKNFEETLAYAKNLKAETIGIIEAKRKLNNAEEEAYLNAEIENGVRLEQQRVNLIAQAKTERKNEADELVKMDQDIGRAFATNTSSKSAKDSYSIFASTGMIDEQAAEEKEWLAKISKYQDLQSKISNLLSKQATVGLTPNQSQKLDEYRDKLTSLESAFDDLEDGVLVSDKVKDAVNNMAASGERDITSYNKILSEFNKNFAFVRKLSDGSEDSIKDALQQYIKDEGGRDLKNFTGTGTKNGVSTFTAEFTGADGAIRKLNASLNTTDNTLRGVVKSGRSTGQFFSELVDTISNKWRSFIGYLSTQVTVMQLWGILKQGIAVVKELDSAFVELKRISNDSASALEDFRKRQFELADTVGTTSATIINAATEWEHLGYSIKEAEELAKTSAIYKNIADGMTSDSEATEDLVSILKAYNFEANQAMDVTDALIATSNNYAVTAADIGNILKRSSAALAMGGNSFEETVALGTAMNEVLQSAEVAGSSLKVLSLRLRSSKTELADMGEETDNLVESTPKLRTQIKALTKGFDILGSDGKTIKSTYEIMKGIAAVWEDMSDVDQAALLELIAGKTRAQGVSALLSNWSQVDNVLKTIAEDEGIALRNNEEKLNTIQGRLTKLTNASQKLASDALNTELIKDFISGVTGAVNALDTLIQKIGLLPTAAGAIGLGTTFTKGGGQLNQSSYPKWMKSYKAPGIVRGNTKQVHAF